MGYLTYVWRLAKEIKNPSLFIYHLFHYANRSIPLFIAEFIRKRNCKQYQKENIGDVLIDTIDGSSQTVHPDIDNLKDQIAFIGTPYPYAMEEYENPCLYIGKDLYSLKMVSCPLDVQHQRIQGVHLSDPCVASDGEKLYCIYRDTRYKDDYIYAKIACLNDDNELEFSDRTLLLEKKQEYALSPAVILKEKSLLMYHVETDKVHSQLVLNTYEKESLRHRDNKVLNISNEPDSFYLWHIGISVNKGYGKLQRENDKLEGLFLYSSINNSRNLKLFHAISDDNIHWHIENEISIPSNLTDIIQFPYKSCFIPNSNKVLLSFRDKKNRNRLIVMTLN